MKIRILEKEYFRIKNKIKWKIVFMNYICRYVGVEGGSLS